jgi:formylmethanofuran dehydrogenase subunit E
VYSDYQQVYQQKSKEKKERVKQLQLLKSYQGCKQCGSKEIDVYSLYEKNRLVCQPCLMKKEGASSSPINFLGQGKWYKKRWGINLTE